MLSRWELCRNEDRHQNFALDPGPKNVAPEILLRVTALEVLLQVKNFYRMNQESLSLMRPLF